MIYVKSVLAGLVGAGAAVALYVLALITHALIVPLLVAWTSDVGSGGVGVGIGSGTVVTVALVGFAAGCAASTSFAAERQLFLPVQGQQASLANHLARLGYEGPVGGLIRTRQRRSADRRGGAHRSPGDTGADGTGTSHGRPDHRAASGAALA